MRLAGLASYGLLRQVAQVFQATAKATAGQAVTAWGRRTRNWWLLLAEVLGTWRLGVIWDANLARYNNMRDEKYLRRIVMPLELILTNYPRIVVKDTHTPQFRD